MIGHLWDLAVLPATANVTWGGYKWTGDFTFVDLMAASTNALNGALLARRPDHYKNFTVVGILLMALLGGLAAVSRATCSSVRYPAR